MAATFEIRGGSLRLVRLGPVNAQKQTHREGNTAPVGRGVWAFPSGHHDPFFFFHRWEELLPKRLSSARLEELRLKDPGAAETTLAEREVALRRIRKANRLTRWWHTGPFYSHVSAEGDVSLGAWHLWENPRDWAREASKHIWCYERHSRGGPLCKMPYSKDHLEIFVPMMARFGV